MAHLPPPLLFLSSFLFPPPFLGFSPLLQRRREEEEVLVLAPRARFLLSSSLPPACRVRDGRRVKERTKGLYCLCWCHPRPRGGIWGGGEGDRMQFFLFSSSACLYNSDTTGGFGGFARREDITSRSLWFPFFPPSLLLHSPLWNTLAPPRGDIDATQRDGGDEKEEGCARTMRLFETRSSYGCGWVAWIHKKNQGIIERS